MSNGPTGGPSDTPVLPPSRVLGVSNRSGEEQAPQGRPATDGEACEASGSM